jgi:hypothetical protein
MQHPYQPPQPEPQPDQPPTGPRIRWLDVRFNGMLLYQVDANDPTHTRVIFKAHGGRQFLQIKNTTLGVTATGLVPWERKEHNQK